MVVRCCLFVVFVCCFCLLLVWLVVSSGQSGGALWLT